MADRNQPTISIVIPTLNEELTIGEFIDWCWEGIQKAQDWLFRNFHNFKGETRVDQLAARVGMSPRNFARRFMAATGETPLAYLHRLRIDAARHLLETGKKGVAEVSAAVGYQDLAFFRRLFKRHTGDAPRDYRERFGRPLTQPPPRSRAERASEGGSFGR